MRPVIRSLTLLWAITATVGVPVNAEDLLRPPGIARTAQIPGLGLHAVETTEGRLVFLSTNGRFAVYGGTVVDLWNGARLDSFEAAQASASRLNIERLGLDPQDLGAISIGEGPATLIFYDPHCPHCQGLLAQLAALHDRYRFHLIALPVLGEPSIAAAVALACQAARDPEAALRRLLDRDFSESAAPRDPACGQPAVQRALVTAQLLGIAGVPYLIGPSGVISQGIPDDLETWLGAAR
ncbi:MAG: DsbC family protein [Chromatiaceae bacterium]|nr:MAG: DsbC family protein [Chromatiaceae bacterium]